MYSVIIVDDEKNILFDIEIILKNCGLRYKNIYKVQTGIEAKRIIESDESVRLILSDINMPEINGLQLLEYISQFKKGIYVIFITGYASFEYAKRAVELGAAGFILKPIKDEELYQCILKAHRLIKADTEFYEKYNVRLIGSILRGILKTGKCTEEEQKYITDVCGLDKSQKLYLAMFREIPDDERISDYILSVIEESNFPNSKLYPFKGYEKSELLCLCVMPCETEDEAEIFSALIERIADTEGKIYISISGAKVTYFGWRCEKSGGALTAETCPLIDDVYITHNGAAVDETRVREDHGITFGSTAVTGTVRVFNDLWMSGSANQKKYQTFLGVYDDAGNLVSFYPGNQQTCPVNDYWSSGVTVSNSNFENDGQGLTFRLFTWDYNNNEPLGKAVERRKPVIE